MSRQRISIKIHIHSLSLFRGLLALLFLTLILAGYQLWNYRSDSTNVSAATVKVSTNEMHWYYLTIETYNGASADTACTTGYHMASLWEILDPANLVYNAALGYTVDDSGQGPPTTRNGWVRTGYEKSISGAGQGNCDVWSNSSSGFGTVAWLNNEWGDTAPSIFVWNAAIGMCDFEPGYHVWCVENTRTDSYYLYLPLVVRG